LVSVLVLACAGGAQAQVTVTPASTTMPVLTVKPLAILSLPTQAGVVYQWQGSPDLQNWRNLGQPVFGTGVPVERPMNGAGTQFCRLQVLTQPGMGTAPWQLEGLAFQLNDGVRTGRYAFATASGGTLLSGGVTKAFTWTWQRDGLTQGKAELNFTDQSREILAFSFNADMAGHFTRRTYSPARLEGSNDGSFGPVPSPVSGNLAPTSIAGRTFALDDMPTGSTLGFTTANSGTRQLEGQLKSFNGNWLVTSATTGRLILNFSATHGEEYTFTFSGPLTGRFTRHTFTEGTFRDEDDGTFCLTSPP